MVLESIIRPIKAIKKPWELFFYGLLVGSVGLFLGFWIFRDRADMVMIFMTTFACVPLMVHTIKNEEELDIKLESETTILKRHSKVILFYTFLFLGITAAFVLWYVVLPASMSHSLFKQQITTIAEINSPIRGNMINFYSFNRILFNNIKVMIFCMLFSFFYGAGAIFILIWNSSVVSAAIGNLIKTGLVKYSSSGFFVKAAAITQTVTYSASRYFIHGIPEMIAYMVAGLAGGILSVAVINKDFSTDNFQKIILDSALLMLIAMGILVFAAIVEAFITPVLF
jgi:uncharacterized membrane protein SpoIIM required for sporulation